MKMLLAIAPTLLLVVFSQLATKWRIQALQHGLQEGAANRLSVYLSDLWIWAAYGAAFVGGIFWMFVVERYAISVAFPVYIGLTVLCVALGGVFMFGETLELQHVLSIVLIIAGVTLAVRG